LGRNGDPSDAWDHAIKAVEDVLIPEMMRNNSNATLGMSSASWAEWRAMEVGATRQ
jgi:hypothetical protein